MSYAPTRNQAAAGVPKPGRDKLACVLIPHLPWQLETARHPALRDVPAIIAGTSDDRAASRIVVDCSHGLSGVVPGMPLDLAMAAYKDARMIEADEAHYRTVSDRITRALTCFVPAVEPESPGCTYVGIWGLERLHGDDAMVTHALANVVQSVTNLDIRLGIGENKWLSHLAARSSRPHSAVKVMVEPGRFASRFPVDVLPVGFRTIQRLQAFGLNTLGDVASLNQGALEAQFGGREGRVIWQRANGIDDRPLSPATLEDVITEYLELPEPAATLSGLLPTLDSLFVRAYSSRVLKGRSVRIAEVSGRVTYRSPWHMRVHFKTPAGTARAALEHVRHRLSDLELPGPLEDLRLTLSGLTAESAEQGAMLREMRREHDLSEAIRKMHAWLGHAPPLYRVRPVEPDSRFPERQEALFLVDS